MRMLKTAALLYVLVCCGSPIVAQDVQKAWKDAFKACGKTELAGKKVKFFGVSNTMGPGSVWRATDQTYALRFGLADLIPDETVRSTVIDRGTPPAECSGTHTAGLAASVSLPFISVFASKAGITGDFSKAKHATVSVDKIAFDELKEVPFEQAVADRLLKNPNDIYARDVTATNRLVLNKAFRISGISVTLDYTPEQLKDLKTKYPNGGSLNVGGDKGATVTFSYSNASTLTLKTSGDIYIAGEFAALKGGTVALGGNQKVSFKLVPVDSSDKTLGPAAPVHQ